MMVLSALRPDASLAEFLAHRARAAPFSRLAIEAVGAAAVIGAASLWNPVAQLLILASAGCFFCYAGWGLLDRARSRATAAGWTATARILRGVCGVCAACGVIAGAGVLWSLWAVALGTWIS
jgi:hypothetical protein